MAALFNKTTGLFNFAMLFDTTIMNIPDLLAYLVLSATAIFIHGATAHTVEVQNKPNNTLADIRCGHGLASCLSSSCCSWAGYCGYSAAHCGAYCQVGRGFCEI